MKRIFFLLMCSILPITIHGMSVQEKKQVASQLEYDLATWEARAQGVSNVKYWAFKGSMLTSVIVLVACYYAMYGRLEDNNRLMLSECVNALLVYMRAGFTAPFFLSAIASEYVSGITNELKLKIERLSQEVQPEEVEHEA